MKFPEAYEVDGAAHEVVTPAGAAQVVLGPVGAAHVAAATLGTAHAGVVALGASVHVTEPRAFRRELVVFPFGDPRWFLCVRVLLRATHRYG